MQLAVLGAGAWGTALAVSFGHHHAVQLWSRNASLCHRLQQARGHASLLPGVTLPASVQVTADLAAALAHAEVVVVAVAVAGVRDVLQQLAAHGRVPPVILACKGFEQGTGLLPHAVAKAVLPAGTSVLALSGPSFASEVAAGLPAALVLSCSEAAPLAHLLPALHHARLRLYSNSDPVGVEIAGALKNVISIAAGMGDGMGMGLNARAALITRGLAEIRRLGEAFGARPDTFLGLAGVGDLMLTCTATLSRNYRVGAALAQGQSLASILTDLGEVAEGVATAKSIARLQAETGVELPICEAVAAVLSASITPQAAIDRLLGREPRAETDQTR